VSTIVRTSYVNVNGTPKVLAKGAGKQRTTAWDLSKSTDWNHGNAAGALALVLGLEWHDGIGHDSNDSGTKHGFSF
jgi:hypothetical protein